MDSTTSRRPDARFLFAHPAHFIALGFGSGLAPRAPGTAGTLAALARSDVLILARAPLDAATLAQLRCPVLLVG